MDKMKRFSAFLLTVLMLFGVIMPSGIVPSAYAENEYAMKFTFNGTQYTVYLGESGSGNGVSWTCDKNNNFSIKFSASGTFTVDEGNISNAELTLVGGGAGGTAGYGVWTRSNGKQPEGYGGNGGGGGELVTKSVTIGEGTTHTIVIGKGGAGGVPATGNPNMAFSIAKKNRQGRWINIF